MGEKGTQTRDSLLDATQDLIETAGYFGTGLNTVIAAAGAPRGSLYFHFPGGKDQLVTEALRRGAQEIGALMQEISETAPSTVAAVTGLLSALADRLENSGWRKGCPVTTVALDVSASSDTLREVCSEVYRSWESALSARLTADGHPSPDDTATTIIALIEGALLLARVHQQREPLERVKRVVAALL